MTLFFWQKNRQHDEFALSLADEFMRMYPLDIAKLKKPKKEQIKYVKAMNMLNRNARDYRVKNSLGIYSKARIGNRFMWSLREQGYDEAFVENITNDLLHTLSNKK